MGELKRVLIPVPQMGQPPGGFHCGFRHGWLRCLSGGIHKGSSGAGCRHQDRPGTHRIKSEEGLLSSYVFVDFAGRDVGGYVDEAKKNVASLKIPEGYRLEWSGEYEYLVKTHERLKLVIPLTP